MTIVNLALFLLALIGYLLMALGIHRIVFLRYAISGTLIVLIGAIILGSYLTITDDKQQTNQRKEDTYIVKG